MRRALVVSTLSMLLFAGSVLGASSAPTACEIDGYVIGGGGGRSEAPGGTLSVRE